MAASVPSFSVIRAQIRAIRNKASNAKVFGIHSPARWTGPSIQGDGDDQIAVFQCDSPLQMRLAMQEASSSAHATVLVTPLDVAKIDEDILVRLAFRRLHSINSWEIIRSLFKARQLDPRITRYPFLAELLLEHVGAYDVSPVPGGFVDAETVWGILLSARLGLTSAHPDVVEILRCSVESDLASRWQSCSPDFRRVANEWISDQAGAAAGAILNCMGTVHGSKALAIGLVLGVVYHEAVDYTLDKAAGRLESYVGQTNLAQDVLLGWRDAASVAAGQLQRPMLRRCLDDAEEILANIGASDFAWHSNDLDSGFEQRLSRLAGALVAHADARAKTISAELQNIYASVTNHRLGREGGRRMERVLMALRLARWLADRASQDFSKPEGLAAIARAYAAEGGFVDWARRVLRGGEPNKDLAATFVRIVDCATLLREEENHRFGLALVEQHAMSAAPLGVIPVEQILDLVLAKVATQVPVLLLLIDGMSWAVFRELVTDIKSRDWIEIGFVPNSNRLVGLAALPSVTEVCRTSLFCGSLKRGQASDEVRGFAEHAAISNAGRPDFSPKLFHKAALEGIADASLAVEIRDAITNSKQRVLGIVINAVDDHLDKGDQTDPIWNIQHIRALEPILAEAHAAGKCVVLVSDHGHTLDRQTQYREGDDGLRWRRPGSDLAKEEVEVVSSRVVMPDGGKVIVPWSEQLRYGPKKNGYHGGASPQEMLIPIGLLWPNDRLPNGFEALPADAPPWWVEPTGPRAAQPIAKPLQSPVKKVQQPTLFEQAPADAVVSAATWISKLLKSDTLSSQKQRAGRAPIEDDKLRKFLEALSSRGGSMTAPALALAIGTPEHRLPGFIATMQRVFNVEGYAILDRQDASNTIVLNIALLKKQFELGSE